MRRRIIIWFQIMFLLLCTVAGIIIRRLGGRWKSKADLLADLLVWEMGDQEAIDPLPYTYSSIEEESWQ
jgi:hypothetical protein